MSLTVLQILRARHAFDPTPRFEDLGVYHVPFDSMLDGGRVEGRLGNGTLSGERIALIGDSGCGKSSVISHVLGPIAEGVAPVLVPVHGLERDAVRAQRLADAVLSELARQADWVGRSTARTTAVMGDRRSVTRQDSRERGAGVSLLGWLSAAIAHQIMEQTTTSEVNSLADKVEVIHQCLDPIHADGLMPVFVFDDTDRWIGAADEDIVTGFFGNAIRWLTDLPVSVVVATHRHYLGPRGDDEGRLRFLDTRVDLPRVPSITELTRILGRRVEADAADPATETCPQLSDAMEPSAVERLFKLYEAGADLRRVMQVAHIAVVDAIDDGSSTVTGHHIRAVEHA